MSDVVLTPWIGFPNPVKAKTQVVKRVEQVFHPFPSPYYDCLIWF